MRFDCLAVCLPEAAGLWDGEHRLPEGTADPPFVPANDRSSPCFQTPWLPALNAQKRSCACVLISAIQYKRSPAYIGSMSMEARCVRSRVDRTSRRFKTLQAA